MTRKLRRNYSLSVVAAFIEILILLIAAAVLAQTSGAGQTTGKANAVLAPASAQTERPFTLWAGAGSSPVSRLQAKRHSAGPMDSPLFLSAATYGSGGNNALSVAVADVNGDGKPDVVVANEGSGTVGVLLGNGDGTFQPAVTYSSGGFLSASVAVADVNGDGKPDIVVSSQCISNGNCANGLVSVLLGNGDGTFQPAVSYSSGGGQAWGVAVADVNHDGKPDLIVANWGSYAVGVLLGNGNGTFQPAVTYGAEGVPYSVAVADVNGDGNPDLLLANTYTGLGSQGNVAVLLGNGDGTFQPAVTYGSGGFPTSIAVADVNGDNKPDLVVANCGANACDEVGEGLVAVLLGNGDGTFQPAVTYDSGGLIDDGVAIADVNGDGKPDLLTANFFGSNVGVLLGNGDGTFQAALTFSIGTPYWIVVADVNGDGLPDVVVACDNGGVGVLLHSDPTTTTLVSSLNPSGYGQAVTFTAAVSSALGTPTGTVIFYDGSTAIGSATLANGRASISVSSLAGGSHSITAAYQGSGAFDPSTSAPLNQVVNPATTTTSLVSSANPARVKQNVTYTATVTSQYGGTATGTVTFQDNGVTIATVTLSGNQAAYSTNYKKGSSHAITAFYSGDGNNLGSTSATLTEHIESVATKTVVTTSGSPSFVGQPVTFSASVKPKQGAIPDGELVTFYDGKTAIGTGATASGMATFITSSLNAETHTIKAAYPGDDTFEPSSGSVKQVVDKYPTTTSLNSSLNPSQSGQAVTFAAHVTSAGPTPTGIVKFLDGTSKLGLVKLNGGVATFTTSKLAVGTHPITVQYLGDANSAKSASPVLDQVVQ